MPRGKAGQDLNILAMALVGYEMERQRIEEKIRQIRARLGKGGPAGAKVAAPRKKRTLSVAARKRIAAAQKRRWAEHRKKVAQAAKG